MAEQQAVSPVLERKEPDTTPAVDLAYVTRRAKRLRESAKCVAMYAAPALLALTTVLLSIVNWQSDHHLLSHVFVSLVSGVVAAVASAAAIWFGMFQMIRVYEKNCADLIENGRLVLTTVVGKPRIYGGRFLTYTVGGVIGALWEPQAPQLATRLPVFQVCYSFEMNGNPVHGAELFYADEQVALDHEGRGLVLVDPKNPLTRRVILRREGRLQRCPGPMASSSRR